jgi:hypothetical protein
VDFIWLVKVRATQPPSFIVIRGQKVIKIQVHLVCCHRCPLPALPTLPALRCAALHTVEVNKNSPYLVPRKCTFVVFSAQKISDQFVVVCYNSSPFHQLLHH